MSDTTAASKPFSFRRFSRSCKNVASILLALQVVTFLLTWLYARLSDQLHVTYGWRPGIGMAAYLMYAAALFAVLSFLTRPNVRCVLLGMIGFLLMMWELGTYVHLTD